MSSSGSRVGGEGEVLVITNHDAEGLLSIEDYIEVVEIAFRELGQSLAQASPRTRHYFPLPEPGHYYWFNNIHGLVPAFNTMAVRLDSAQARLRDVNGQHRLDFPGDFAGFVILYRLDTREPYAIIHDHALSPFRVAATSAIASKRLAPSTPTTMGLFGAGEQAKAQAQAHVAIFPSLRTIRCYTPTPERRRDNARALARATGVEVLPVEDPREAVADCDIVTTATNSGQPVFRAAWLQPGQHVNSNLGCDFFVRLQDTEEEVVQRADLVVVNYRRQLVTDDQPEIMHAVRKGYITLDKIVELGELVTGKHPGRTNGYHITFHYNNVGMGIQFAAAGAKLVEKARAAGRGTPLPVDLFMTRRGDALYAP